MDAYNAVGDKLEDALKDIDSLIMDLDSGMYDKNVFEDFEDD